MRFVIAAGGALLGLALGNRGDAVWNLLVGACLGFALAEVRVLRSLILQLKQEIESIGHSVRSQRRVETPAQQPVAQPEGARKEFHRPTAADHPLIPPPSVTPPASPLEDPVEPATLSPAARAAHPTPTRVAPVERPLIAAVRRFFTGGNTLVRVGIVVLFFGVAFLLRYAAEHSHLPIELRLSAVAVGAMVLLMLGWRLRHRRAGYAFALEGGGVGMLYLTVFAAFRLYQVMPQSTAFLILALIALLAAGIAVLQDSQSFALLGVSGGFLAPVLASTGEGSHVALFSYFLVLNSGIAVIAWFKAWRPLNLAGFVFTFAIATAWGVLKYRVQDFPSTEPFLVAFFLMFVGIAVLHALRQPLRLRGYVDGTLVFGTPIAAFGLQTAMLHQDSMALAYSSLVMSGFYLLLSGAVRRFRDPTQGPLFESFLALGLVFLTLAIPLALGNRLNSAAWALEGTGLVWIGCRQYRRLARASGSALIIASAVLLVPELRADQGHWELPWASYPAVVLVSVACLTATRILESALKQLNELENLYRPVLFSLGAISWCVGSLGELPHLASGAALLSAATGFLALTAVALSELARRVSMPFAGAASLLLLPVLCVLAGISFAFLSHPLQGAGWLAWPAAFACLYLITRRHEQLMASPAQGALHVASLWLIALLSSAESHWMAMHVISSQGDWAPSAAVVVPCLMLSALPKQCRGSRWPFAAHRSAFLMGAAFGLALVIGLISAAFNFSMEGDASPLAYLPVLNPLDVAEMLMLLALLNYARAVRDGHVGNRLSPVLISSVLAALAFIWCNGVVLRTLHHLLNIPYTLEALCTSNVVETTVTIFWSILALLTMLTASRRHNRTSWLVGAGLLVLVIAKLFFVDLSSVGSIERIVSFVGVGVLMLVVGYFSPLPPRATESS